MRARRILLHAVLAAAAALAAGITGAAARLAQDDDVARRTFANAEQLLREGKSEQGLRDFAQVATAFPTSDLADDALYRIGAFLYPGENVAALGKADAASLARARDQFEKIRTQYPQGDAAPAALFKLGLIDLEPANPKRSADEAYAHFTSVTNIYPDSGMVPDALFGAGWVDFAAGRHAKAIGPLQRLAEEYPAAPEAEEALQLMGMAYARLGQYPRALDQFQALRDRFPSGALRDRALDRLTQIYRIRMRPAWGIKPALAYDASFAPALEPEFGKSEVAMAVMPDGALRLLDCKTGAQITLGANGKVAARASTPGARGLQVDPNGIVTLTFQSKVQVGPNVLVPGDPREAGAARCRMSRRRCAWPTGARRCCRKGATSCWRTALIRRGRRLSTGIRKGRRASRGWWPAPPESSTRWIGAASASWSWRRQARRAMCRCPCSLRWIPPPWRPTTWGRSTFLIGPARAL